MTSSASTSASSAAGTSKSGATAASDKEGWGANFWVTLADPSSGAEFYACPATGEVAWDPPEGNFVLPRSADGEWWEIEDTSGSGLPYYYHTLSGDTVWTRPEGFVIPLAIIQTTTLGKRLSTAYLSPRTSIIAPALDTQSSSRSRR
ncbi:hypothetical protein AURDEDRAFT_173168 [Auricularia subglabra TFB-10046 SS5]|nr:hypothetical protein AURDEDRAFT_173168 [Auricularia subglabra TFB-10046 SS5]